MTDSTAAVRCVQAGACVALLSVVLGAFGAHWLKGHLEETAPDQVAERLDQWEVGARYQMYHGLGLLAVGILSSVGLLGAAPTRQVMGCMLAGVLVFSGCLYALVLTGVKVLGAIVPIGGTLLIVGWIRLLVGLGPRKST